MTDFRSRNAVFLRRFGVDAMLTRKADSTSETFVGVFSAAGHDATIRLSSGMAGQALTVSSAEPWIWVSLDAAWIGAMPAQGDTITVAGVEYRVHDPQPDGQGGLKLILKKR
jgi:hypothetical protein